MTSDFDTSFAEAAPHDFTDRMGETITYYPSGGSSRSITGAVVRNPVTEIDAAPGPINAPFAHIQVIDDSTLGIASDEINTGADEIGYKINIGDAAVSQRPIAKIVSRTGGMMTLEVR